MMTNRTNEENYVLRAARRYARMKLTGTYVDNDGWISSVDPRQRGDHEQLCIDRLLRAARTMFIIMATDEVDGKLVE